MLQWKTRIISLRDVPPGQAARLRRNLRHPRAARIAVIAAGYGDGYSRKHSYPRNGSTARIRNGTAARSFAAACLFAAGTRRSWVASRWTRRSSTSRIFAGCEIGDEVVLIGQSGGGKDHGLGPGPLVGDTALRSAVQSVGTGAAKVSSTSETTLLRFVIPRYVLSSRGRFGRGMCSFRLGESFSKVKHSSAAAPERARAVLVATVGIARSDNREHWWSHQPRSSHFAQ